MKKRKIRKALLFIPPAFTFKDYLDINPLPPLGLGYIAAVLELQDIEVKIVDCLMEGWHKRIKVDENVIRIGLDFNSIRKIIENYAPDIVGVNSLFTKQRQNAHKIYELAKEISEDIITVAGGAHPTVMPELVLSDKNVDYIVIGEGEETIVDLINVIEGVKDISALDGIGYKEDGDIRMIPKTKFILDLDKLPFPARHLLNLEKYFGLKMSHGARKKKKFSPIITSRGCPAKCTFCSAHKVWGRKFRQRSPENVIAEMKHIKERYGIEEIMFEDLGLPWIEEKIKASHLVPRGWKFETITKKGILPRVHKKRTMMEAIKRNELFAREVEEATKCEHDDALRALVQAFGDINEAIDIIKNNKLDKDIDPYVLIEDEDMRYKQIEEAYELQSNCVVIAMMDTSGSMTTDKKYLCRSLLFWLVEFLKKVYDNVDIKFIAHTTEAKVVDEDTFFHKGESGGTYCWSAIDKAIYLIDTEYPVEEWNVYCVYVSDGEDFEPDKTVRYIGRYMIRHNFQHLLCWNNVKFYRITNKP